MKAKDTQINQGGLYRCCIQTIHNFVKQNPEKEVRAGFILDCEYEPPGNKRIVFSGGCWKWKKDRAT